MRKSRFTPVEIADILKEANIGVSAGEVARKYGISPATFYNWKAKYDVMDTSPVKQLRDMAAQLAQYKTMYAELAHENFSLRNQMHNAVRKSDKESNNGDEG